MLLRNVIFGAFLGCGVLLAAAAPQARAQHLVTDNEAAKLTLDALTATPRPVYRPIYRQIMATRRAHRPGYIAHQMHARTENVAFPRSMTPRGRRR